MRVQVDTKFYKHLDYGYAATVHRARGTTVDHSYVLAASRFDRRTPYVALSRHATPPPFSTPPTILAAARRAPPNTPLRPASPKRYRGRDRKSWRGISSSPHPMRTRPPASLSSNGKRTETRIRRLPTLHRLLRRWTSTFASNAPRNVGPNVNTRRRRGGAQHGPIRRLSHPVRNSAGVASRPKVSASKAPRLAYESIKTGQRASFQSHVWRDLT
jgi:hypothetical protein